MRKPIPLTKRPLDIVFLIFFFINLTFITYIVDLEQLVIANPASFSYPVWPPAMMVDLVHWWGKNFDPVLLARPVWWKATIWIDSLFFGPFYAVALYAFYKGREWIRIPSIIWASVMMTNVTIIMAEEFFGPHASPRIGIVTLANAAWFIFPIIMIWRMAKSEHPFTRG